jgi:hypothetical protein
MRSKAKFKPATEAGGNVLPMFNAFRSLTLNER